MKTLEEFKKECDEISEQINKIAEKRGPVAIDGVINPERYLKARHRVMWVLKEPNDPDISKTWSFLKNFQDEEWLLKYCRNPTIMRVIYTSYGILKAGRTKEMNHEEWTAWPDCQEQKSSDVLKEIAYVNIKKTPGGGTCNRNEINEAYEEFHDLLKRQIEVYNPDIVIFGGTFYHIDKDDFNGLKEAEKQPGNVNRGFYTTKDKLYIDAYHPAARETEVSAECGFEYITDIVNIVRNWEKNK